MVIENRVCRSQPVARVRSLTVTWPGRSIVADQVYVLPLVEPVLLCSGALSPRSRLVSHSYLTVRWDWPRRFRPPYVFLVLGPVAGYIHRTCVYTYMQVFGIGYVILYRTVTHSCVRNIWPEVHYLLKTNQSTEDRERNNCICGYIYPWWRLVSRPEPWQSAGCPARWHNISRLRRYTWSRENSAVCSPAAHPLV